MKPEIGHWLSEQFGDDAELHGELYGQYATDMRRYLLTLKDRLIDCDAEGVAETSHTMKGVAMQMGDCETANACRVVQEAARAGDIATCVTAFPVARDLIGAL